MEALFSKFYEKYAQTNTSIIRDYMNRVDWSNRFVGIKGSRGVGKTTLLLQYIRQHFAPRDGVLYISLDNLYFGEHSFYDTVDQFVKRGGQTLVVDEVHRYPEWSLHLKNIYDDFPALKVVFTGSSLIQLSKSVGDLSRRVVMYSMPSLSFREFIHFETGESFSVVSLDDLLQNHVEIATQLISKIRPLAWFAAYLNYGCYPFYLENKASVHLKLEEIVQVVLEVDIPQFENIQTSNIFLLKRLLQLIASSVPFKPNYHTISQRTGLSINTLKSYLHHLEKARLISLLHRPAKGFKNIGKTEKIFLHNPNLMYALAGDNRDKGSLRETFFYNQLSENYPVHASMAADFLVDGQYHFEIGGKGKTHKQIRNLSKAYVVKDDIEVGHENVIPLWLFGFLY
jgi:uncharacterized protein